MLHRLALLIPLALAACAPDTDDAPASRPAGPARRPPPALPPESADALRQLERGVSYLQRLDDAERTVDAAQRARVQRAVADVQQAIAAGDLDRAEARLADVFWEPPTGRSVLSAATKKQIEQTDARRRTLQAIIDRKRAGVR